MRIYNCILIVLCVSAYKNQKISKVTQAAFLQPSTSSSLGQLCHPSLLTKNGAKSSEEQFQPNLSLRHRGKTGLVVLSAAPATATEINTL